MEEKNNNQNKKTKRINFFKKVWNSITKFDRYIDMVQEGARVATKYLAITILIIALAIAIVGIYDTNKKLDESVKYVSEEVPEFIYQDSQLKSDVSEVYRVEKDILGIGNIIVDLQTEEESKIEGYKKEISESEETIGIIILKNKIIQVAQTQEKEMLYDEIATTLLGKTDLEFTKEDIVNYLNEDGRTYILVVNFITYLIGYYITYFISTFIYILLLMLMGNLTSTITKTKLKMRDLYSISIYALTLSNILSLVNFVIRYFTDLYIKYFDVAYISIAYVYIITVIFLIKSNTNIYQENHIEESNKENDNKSN